MLRSIVSNDLYIVLLIFCLILITAVKQFSPKRFNDFVLVLGNYKYLKIYTRDQKFFDRFDALLFINLIISLSVFGFILYERTFEYNSISIDLMFKLSFALAVFILIKVLIERLIGSLFEIDHLISEYLFQKISYKNYLGILLLPINILLLFSFKPTLLVVCLILAILLIVLFVGLITSIKAHLSLIKRNFIYFILYLCALEIAPYTILYKVFVFLNNR